MKSITLRIEDGKGDLKKEEQLNIQDGNIIILKIPTNEHGGWKYSVESIEDMVKAFVRTLKSTNENRVIILPDKVQLQILSIE